MVSPTTILVNRPTLVLVYRSTLYSKMLDHIFYINLDKRFDRKSEIESELIKMGLFEFERFRAIEYPFPWGCIGASESHLSVLKLARENNYKNVLILEDDFTFDPNLSIQDFQNILSQITNYKYDVCLLAYNVVIPTPISTTFIPPNPNILDRIENAQTASAYIIENHYYDILIDEWETSLIQLRQTGQHWHYALDQSWKKLQSRDTWIGVYPAIGKQRESYSDIGYSVVNYGC